MAASRPPPSFFSLMLDTSATTLQISTEFVTKHLKNKIPKDPINICANGGYSWRIKIKKIGENYYFENGWSNVVKDVNFMFGDFVLFRLVDKYTFKMFVYGKNSVERSLPKKVKVEYGGSISVDNVALNVEVVNDDDVDDSEDDDDDVDDDDDDVNDDVDDDDVNDDVDDDVNDDVDDDVYEGEEEEEEDDDDDDVVVDIDGDDGDPFFISTISKAHKTNLRLPDEFVELSGIEDERSIMLKNLDGEEWRMELLPEKVNQSEKLYISSGWADFQQSNDLREGDECVFKFVTSEGKILLAKVTKKKRPARRSQAYGECSKTEVAKRKRGRELHAHGRDVDVESEDEYMERAKRLRDDDADDDADDEDEDEHEDEDGESDNDDDDGSEGEEDDEEEDGVDIDGNPFFTPIISRHSILRLPTEFVGLPGIKANGTIILKNLKGEEWPITVLLDTGYQKKRYLLSKGMIGFMRSNNISVGDKCILKFIRNEGKFCLAKVTKKRRPAWQPRPQPSGEIPATEDVKRKRGRPRREDGGDVDVESEDDCVEVVRSPCGEDNHNDNDGEDDGGADIDGDLFFMAIIEGRSTLRLPEEFAGLPGLHADGTIMVKNLKGEEWQIGVRLDKRYLKSERYAFSAGWLGFQRSNDLSVGDECTFKFIRKERKFCLAKVTKKQRKPWKPRPSGQILATEDVKRKRGRPPHAQGVVGDIDGNPFFVLIISSINILRLPGEFAGLPGIKANGTIMLKNLKGEEWRIGMLLDKRYLKSERYILSAGLPDFMRSNDIMIGDECIIKFIRNEGKLCLAKVTNENSPARHLKRKRGQPALENLGDVDVKNEHECVEVVKRPCGEDNDEEDDWKDDGQDNGVDDDKDNDNDGEDDKDGDVGDPSFSTIISKNPALLLPVAFEGLPRIKEGGTIMLKNLKGEECPMGVRLNKKYQKSKRYILSAGWVGFLRNNSILVGDECVFKFIRNEGKLCLEKVTKKNSPTRQAQPSGQILVTEVVKSKRGRPRSEDPGDMDVEIEGDGKEDDEDDEVEDDDDGQDDDDDNENDGQDGIDAGGGDIDGDVGDLSFTRKVSNNPVLVLPEEFGGLPGIKDGGSIMIKNLKGEEWSLGVRLNTAYQKSPRYLLSAGFSEFFRGNKLSAGDECVFKFIRKEGKLCLVKVTKNKRQLGSRISHRLGLRRGKEGHHGQPLKVRVPEL